MRIYSRALRYLFYILILPIYWLGHLIPRNNKLWLFGNAEGRFTDNPRYVMEFVRKKHPDIRAVWISLNRQTCEAVRELGFECHPKWSLRGIWLGLRAGAGFGATGRLNHNQMTSGGMYFVQLWHGMPLKRLDGRIFFWWKGYETRIRKTLDWVHDHIFPFIAHNNYDLVTSSSPLCTERLAQAFRIPEDRFAVTGFARADVILSSSPPRPACLETISTETRVILYAPTFREWRNDKSWHITEEMTEFSAMLERHNAVLVVKGHANTKSFMGNSQNNSRIHHINTTIDINYLYPHVDVVVADYSSVMFDYCLLGRPMVFFAPDLDNYRAQWGLYEDYESLSEGRYAGSWEELCVELDTCLGGENDWYRERTRRLNARANAFNDQGNCARIVSTVRERLHV